MRRTGGKDGWRSERNGWEGRVEVWEGRVGRKEGRTAVGGGGEHVPGPFLFIFYLMLSPLFIPSCIIMCVCEGCHKRGWATRSMQSYFGNITWALKGFHVSAIKAGSSSSSSSMTQSPTFSSSFLQRKWRCLYLHSCLFICFPRCL